VIGAHADTNLKDILTRALFKPGEAADVGLKAVTRFFVSVETLLGGETLRVDLAAGCRVPEPADLCLQISLIHVRTSQAGHSYVQAKNVRAKFVKG
jgi:hypothetical protein